MIEVLERHEDVRVVMARSRISTIGMSEHPPEAGPGLHGHPARSVVDHTVLGEKFDDLVVEPVIDAVRIAMNKVDDLVLVD
jgi:hypothetical protein